MMALPYRKAYTRHSDPTALSNWMPAASHGSRHAPVDRRREVGHRDRDGREHHAGHRHVEEHALARHPLVGRLQVVGLDTPRREDDQREEQPEDAAAVGIARRLVREERDGDEREDDACPSAAPGVLAEQEPREQDRHHGRERDDREDQVGGPEAQRLEEDDLAAGAEEPDECPEPDRPAIVFESPPGEPQARRAAQGTIVRLHTT